MALPLKSRAARQRAVTLKDVALAAGVTPMTVSNVLNKRSSQVSKETRDKVLVAIEQLGYRPHAIARRLRSGRRNAIGMLVLDDVPAFLSDPFTNQVIAGLSNVAADNGYSLVLQGVRYANFDNAPLLSQLEADGVCALLSGSSEQRRTLVARLTSLGIPLVLVQEKVVAPGVCTIRQNDRGGAVEIARHVLSRGARRIMMLLPAEEWPAMIEREAGVREACAAAGAELIIVRCGDEGLADTQAALAAAIETHGVPDAVVGGNDRMAMAALKWLAENGFKVPDTVRVTGFNAFDFSTYTSPALTTVRSAAYEMGRRAGQELLANLRTGSFTADDIVLPVAFEPAASS
jgi:LacI family transcriptional regulator